MVERFLQKILLRPSRGLPDWGKLFENVPSQTPRTSMNPRTSLAAGNYRSNASDKVQLNTCTLNGSQQSVKKTANYNFFENLGRQISENNNERKKHMKTITKFYRSGSAPQTEIFRFSEDFPQLRSAISVEKRTNFVRNANLRFHSARPIC